MAVPSSVEWETRPSRPTLRVSADAIRVLAGRARRRTGEELPCGECRMKRVAWNTTAGVLLPVFVVVD